MNCNCTQTRKLIIEALGSAKSGHPGGSLSEVEILVSLYTGPLRHDPQNPSWEDRDRFILSKGHGAPGLYAILAQCGYFPLEELLTLRSVDSPLQGHPDWRKLPGLDATSGSLGQGLSVGVGMALGAKAQQKDFRVYVLVGDGELNEGQIWEAALAANRFRLNNLTVIVDRNRLQLDGPTEEIMPLEPLADKWQAFGWNTLTVDGHDLAALQGAYQQAIKHIAGPTVIIANTIKGKGVSFLEDQVESHGKVLTPQEVKQALAEITGEVA